MPESLGSVRAILIPDDGRDPIVEVKLAMTDGGFDALTRAVEGEPEDIDLRGRDNDTVAFRNEAGMRSGLPRNNRATRLLSLSLLQGEWVGGPLVLVGQNPDLGLADLPADITVAQVEDATKEEN